jgi:hypothetical protein
MTTSRTAPYLSRGTWAETDDIVENAWAESDDYDGAIYALGYTLWSRTGTTRSGGGINVSAYERISGPRFLLRVDGGMDGDVYSVYADTVVDVMQLLAQWAPAIPERKTAKALEVLTGEVAAAGRRLSKSSR